MKISDYIAELQTIMAEHGDLEVETLNYSGYRVSASEPDIAFRKILVGRQSKPDFWWRGEGEDRKGEKVCRV